MGRRKIDMTGERFGKWTVLCFAHVEPRAGHAYWECKCDCGTEVTISGRSLRQGTSTQCQDCSNAAKTVDLSGRRFGRWTVLRRATEADAVNWRWRWICRCDCGTEKPVTRQSLAQGTSVRCRTCSHSNRTNA